MKSILSIIISGALVVSGYAQTRNVLVGTNNAVVQPTNFWSADASSARAGLGLGTAATNPATAFQPSSSVLSNLATGNGSNLTNISASIVGTNVSITNVGGLQSALDGKLATNGNGSGITNISGANIVGAVASASNITGTIAISNVSNLQSSLDGKLGTNPTLTIANITGLQTNLDSKLSITGNAVNLTNFPASLLRATGDASGLTNFPILNQNTTGTASNVTGVVSLANGGTGATNASSARTALGGTTVGGNLFALPNPDDVRFLRLNANNSVSALTAADFRAALSVGTNVGTVTSVGLTVPAIFSLSTPTITSGGTFALTLANQTSRHAFLAPNGGGIPSFRAVEPDDLPSLAISKITGLQTALDGKLSTTGTAALATNVTGVVVLANGGTSGTNAESARTGLGATTVGGAVFTLPNPSAIRFLRYNADNTVSTLSDSDFRTAIGLNTAATNLASAFQPSSTTLSNLSLGNGSGLTNVTASAISFALAISNTTGLQAALDGKLATNGSAAGLTSFPTLNQNTTGTASNVIGVVSLANGGTGSTNAADARTALGLGTAATSAVTAFQPSSTVLSNLANNNGASLTNITAANIGTVALASNVTGVVALVNGGTGATNASDARSNLGLGSAATNPATAFQSASLALSNLASSNGGSLTNITAANIAGTVGLASNVTGTAPLATNVTGVVALANGGTAGTNAVSARTSLGATTVGANLFTLVNPDDTRFIRLNANNTVSALSAADMRIALSVGTNAGTVTSVGMTVPNIFSLSTPTITSSGTFGITLASQSSRQAFLVPNGGGIPAFRGIESDDLPSLAISKITGLQTAIDGKLATNGTAPLAVNVTGTVAVANGGTGGTTAETARTGLGASTIGSGLFTLFNPSAVRFIRLNADNTVSSLSDSDFRTAIGLASAATNPATAFQSSSANLTNLAANNGSSLTNIPLAGVNGALATNGNAINLTNFPSLLLRTNGNGEWLTNITAANITGTVAQASNVTGTIAISNGGSGATTAGGARTNLGLGATNNAEFNSVSINELRWENGLIFDLETTTFQFPIDFNNSTNKAITRGNLGLGWSGLTNTNASTFRSALELGTTNTLTIAGIVAQNLTITAGGGITLQSTLTNAASFRTNIGIPWSGLTNTNAATFQTALFGTNTNPVLVNTNGEVVSPTNFWQVAPIQTLVQDLTVVVTTQTNNATNARNLYVYSLATNVSGISNTILLPTNAATFAGDEVTVIHQGTTNTTTVIRQAGSTNNLITLSRFDESVKFIRELGQWDFYHNISFVEPIQFSGTNTAANAAASRTNLGLGATWLTNTNVTNFRSAVGLGASNAVAFNDTTVFSLIVQDVTPISIAGDGLSFNDTNSTNIASAKAGWRDSLGLPLPALTNTNNANFQAAVFQTNTTPAGAAFNNIVAWMEVNVFTNGSNTSFRVPLFK